VVVEIRLDGLTPVDPKIQLIGVLENRGLSEQCVTQYYSGNAKFNKFVIDPLHVTGLEQSQQPPQVAAEGGAVPKFYVFLTKSFLLRYADEEPKLK
jgi:hypothetical protein